jgi:hypothetical protein
MSEFTLPLGPRDREWVELRERLARAARELHFSAVSNDSMNGAALLAIAGSLAGLAMSIPMCPAGSSSHGPIHGPTHGMSGGLVDASTLLATQVLQGGPLFDGETMPANENT